MDDIDSVVCLEFTMAAVQPDAYSRKSWEAITHGNSEQPVLATLYAEHRYRATLLSPEDWRALRPGRSSQWSERSAATCFFSGDVFVPELKAGQPAVELAAAQQAVVGAGSHQLTVVQNGDLVGVEDGAQPVPGGNEWWEVSKAKFPVVSDYLDQRILELKDSVVPTHLDFEGWLNRTKHPDWPLLAVSGVKTKQI